MLNLNVMDEKIFSDLEQKMVKLFSKKDRVVYNEHLELSKFNRYVNADLFLTSSKVSMLIFGTADCVMFATDRHIPRVDLNAPILDGFFPLHLAVLTASKLLVELVESYGAKLDVKCCGDPNSPFYALTPLELALVLMRNSITWTPQNSLHELLCMFHDNVEMKPLMVNISMLLKLTPSIRHFVSNYSLQGKVVEVATILKAVSPYHMNLTTMYIPTANIPPQLHFGVPMMLRLLVSSRYAALIKEAIQISGSLNPEEYNNCRRKIKEMDSIRILLETAERGDLNSFAEEQQLTVELTDGSSDGSQDEFKFNTVAPRYLNKSLFFLEPSKFQPPGVYNSLMPHGYKGIHAYYDGLDCRNCNALAETIFRRKTHCCENRDKNLCVEDWSSFPSKELCPIRRIIENDDVDEFHSFLRKSKTMYRSDDVLLKYAGFEICPYGILGKICHYRATKCATLLLSSRRKLGSLMNLNILNCYGSYPLHDAAISLSATLVKLLIDRGASLEARSLDVTSISPLEYAVVSLSCDRNLIHWSPKKSVFKLIITLCLPQMKEALKTIYLLAGVSSDTAIMRDTIFSSIKRGQVVPVAVLLLLARDRVMQSFYKGNQASSGRDLLFPESIMLELATLINQESSFMGCKEHAKILQLCREKKELMIYILEIIEIFNRAGPDLKSYLETRTSDVTNEKVSYHVAELLKKAGFILSTDDPDISNIMSSLEPDSVPLDTTVNQQGYDEEDDPKGIFFKPCRGQLCRCDMKIPSCATSNVFQRIVRTSFVYKLHRGFSSRAAPSIHQPLWTIPRRENCFLSRSPNIFEKVGSCDKSGSNLKHKPGNWFQLQMSKRVVRSGFILVSALTRKGPRGF